MMDTEFVVIDTDVISYLFKGDTTALLYDLPLLTHNRDHFARVPNLSVISEA